MTNFSDSSPRDASSSELNLGATSLQSALNAGLAALKQKDYSTAIAHLEGVYHANPDLPTRLKAQIGLVKAYTRTDQAELAIAYCQSLCESTNPQVRSWATQTLASLTQSQPSTSPNPLAAQVDPHPVEADETGFVPLSPAKTPLPPSEEMETGEIETGFIPLTSVSQDEPVTAISYPTSTPPKTSLPPSLPTAPSSSSPPPPPPPPSSSTTAIQPTQTPLTWKQADRAQRWTNLGQINPLKLRLLQAGTVVALFGVIALLVQFIQAIVNWFLLRITWPINLQQNAYYGSWNGAILLGLVILFCVSPWLLDAILNQFYNLKPFSLLRLEQFSPEAARLLKRAQQQNRPAPTLRLLPTSAPLAFTYGYLPRNARIVVSQGLLKLLNDDEIATIYAAELGHIRHWDFGVMSLIATAMQLPYLVYWHVALWGDRQHDRVLQSLAVVVSSIAYGIFWVVRLPGLWLSRHRLYHGDRTVTELTGNPNALTRALLKITIRTAKEVQQQSETPPLLESFEPLLPVSYRSALTLGSLYPHTATPDLLEWDRTHPNRHWLAINNTHPPLGDRLNLLTHYARHWQLEPELDWNPASSSESQTVPYQAIPHQAIPHQTTPQKLTAQNSKLSSRFLLQAAPFLGILVGLAVALLLWLVGWIALKINWLGLGWLWGDRALLTACSLIGFSVGMVLRISPYFPDIKRSSLKTPVLAALIADPEAMPIDNQPIRLQGTLIGRQGFLNWQHQDLLLQTSTALVKLHYTSRFGAVGNLFSQPLRPSTLKNRPVTVTGWFRRGATPWIDVETIQTQGGTILVSQHPLWSTILACLSALLGIYIIFQGG